MKIGVYGGGFKPFTTGHFAKLANAIRDNDYVYLFYGIQEEKPTEYYLRGSKKGQPKVDKRLRKIGSEGKLYTPTMSREIFNIYEQAIEREFPSVEVELTIGSSPVNRILDVASEFADNPDMYEKMTVYGDSDTFRSYINRHRQYFGDLLGSKILLGPIPPESPADYVDEEKFEEIARGSESDATDSLSTYYGSLSRDQLERLKSIRGTEVRDFASTREGIEKAKLFLPPFLNNDEKERVVRLMVGEGDSSTTNESTLGYMIQGFIRG